MFTLHHLRQAVVRGGLTRLRDPAAGWRVLYADRHGRQFRLHIVRHPAQTHLRLDPFRAPRTTNDP